MADSNIPPGATTFHLAPVAVWLAQRGQAEYLPEAFGREGFIHCTDGGERVIEVGNRYYRDDHRPFCVLTIAVDRLTAPVRYDDAEQVYPHIYGPLNVDAVVSVRQIERSAGGAFLAIGAELGGT